MKEFEIFIKQGFFKKEGFISEMHINFICKTFPEICKEKHWQETLIVKLTMMIAI